MQFDNVKFDNITIIPPLPPTSTLQYLVVAGGGSGGTCNDTHLYGGGGGAGGMLTGTISSGITNGTTFTITIGAGGTNNGQIYSGVHVTSGNDSSLISASANIYCYGGGKGGLGSAGGSDLPANGGSGGGQGRNNPTNSYGIGVYPGSTYIDAPRQGYDGANGGGSGGGGAGGSPSPNYNGGVGLSSSITGSAVTYATGGGAYTNSTPGGTNTGEGGGGGQDSPWNLGGTGGSGIVVVRYAKTFADAASTTGSPTVTTSGSYKIYIFNSSGTITF